MSEQKTAITATGVVKKTPGYYWGYIVTTTLSAAAVTLQDHASAASGTVVDVIPASTPAGTARVFPTPVRLSAGLYATIAGTGTILLLTD